jgi:hypothetical protein
MKRPSPYFEVIVLAALVTATAAVVAILTNSFFN